MDEKLDTLLVKKNKIHSARARSIENFQPIVFNEDISSGKIRLVKKIKDENEEGQSAVYFLKQHDTNPRLAELEAYCGAISLFLATSRYVPKTRPYYDSEGRTNHVSSKEMVGFLSNYEEPLSPDDLLISSPEINKEMNQRSLVLITENLLAYYNKKNPSGGLSYYTSLSFISSWLNTTPTQYSTRSVLLHSLNHPTQDSIYNLFRRLRERREHLRSQAVRPADFLNEYYYLNQTIRQLEAFICIGIIDEPVSLSIKEFELIDKDVTSKGIDLDQYEHIINSEIDGTNYTVPVRDLKNYRTVKGLGVGLTTRYIFKEGDGHNSNMSKDGIILDFDWTKANILSDFRQHDAFNQLLRHPDSVAFACDEYTIKHFPDINEPNLFYWPTKQPDLRTILLTNLAGLLSVIDRDVIESNLLFNLVPVHLLLATFEYVENEYLDNANKTYFEQISTFFHGIYLQLNGIITNQPRDQLIVKEKIRHLFNSLLENANQLADLFYFGEKPLDARTAGYNLKIAARFLSACVKHYTELRSELIAFTQGPLFKFLPGFDLFNEQKLEQLLWYSDRFIDYLKDHMEQFGSEIEMRYERFEQNSFTIEDNTHYKLLAGHPVFIFHKYKTFLKYVLTDTEVFRIYAELNIAVSPVSSSDAPMSIIHEKLIADEANRVLEIAKTLVSMPDFKRFLKEHGQFAFELIKEEFTADRDKYSKKTHDLDYYERLVNALDPERIESKFNELCSVCEAEEPDLSSEEDMVYPLCI